jgi:hypothetical protein
MCGLAGVIFGNKRRRAEEREYLDAVPAKEKGWRELPVPPMSLVVFRREDQAGYSVEPFEFVAQERKGAEP